MILKGPGRDGFAVEWPVTYDELAPWYSHVEKFAGISGNFDGLDTLPDGEFLPAWEMNCVESEISSKINAHYKDSGMWYRDVVHTSPNQVTYILQQGSNPCQARSRLRTGLPLWRIFQFQFNHHSLGGKNG